MEAALLAEEEAEAETEVEVVEISRQASSHTYIDWGGDRRDWLYSLVGVECKSL